MYDFLIYSLKTAACLAVFYLFYKLLLSRETFHRVNRIVLLSVMAASFILPLCIITIYKEAPVSQQPQVYDMALVAQMIDAGLLDPYAPAEAGNVTVTGAVQENAVWKSILTMLFIAGAGIALLSVMIAVLRVMGVIRTGEKESLDRRTVLVKKKEQIVPFSWVRYIVVSKSDLAHNGEQIISHEKAHIELRHSFDLMLADLFCCLQWFNPAVWLLRSELTAIHEYEADRAVLAGGADPKAYQMLLIKKAVGTGRYSIANSLNHSKLKNRITMMLQKKSSPGAKAKIFLLLPMLCLALTAFARTEYVAAEDKIKEKETIIPIQTNSLTDTVLGSGSNITAQDKTSGDVTTYTVGNDKSKKSKVRVMSVNGPVELENSTMITEDGTRVEIKRGTIHTSHSPKSAEKKEEVTKREPRIVISASATGASADGSQPKVVVKTFPASEGRVQQMTINVNDDSWSLKADSVMRNYTFSFDSLPDFDMENIQMKIEGMEIDENFFRQMADSMKGKVTDYRFDMKMTQEDMDYFRQMADSMSGKFMDYRFDMKMDQEKMNYFREWGENAEKEFRMHFSPVDFSGDPAELEQKIREAMEEAGMGAVTMKFHIDTMRINDLDGPTGQPVSFSFNNSGADNATVTVLRSNSGDSFASFNIREREKMNVEVDRRGRVKVEGMAAELDELPHVIAEVAANSGKLVTDYQYDITASPKTKMESVNKVKNKLRGMGVSVKVVDPTE